ncbi:MAG: DUF4143 domain-containing protein [Calditrichaeota bacterium]|nr:MAG: DUF4143 domain-containing protein [Calditrichota bacterium]
MALGRNFCLWVYCNSPEQSDYRLDSLTGYLFRGFYPRIYDLGISPVDWYPNYVQTYVERDVRLVRNISDVHTFHRFLRMCAARVGQLVNLVSLANDCGITHNTAKAWLSILEASFIIFFLQPHHRNFNKRLVKSPKLYFYDPGLVCSLLAVQNEQQLDFHPMKGSLFESMLISEMMKHYFNQGLEPQCFFWRDKVGHEIDCLLETGESLVPVEFKAGQTITPDFFKNLNYWRKLSGVGAEHAYVIYGGEEVQSRSTGQVLGWRYIDRLLSRISS